MLPPGLGFFHLSPKTKGFVNYQHGFWWFLPQFNILRFNQLMMAHLWYCSTLAIGGFVRHRNWRHDGDKPRYPVLTIWQAHDLMFFYFCFLFFVFVLSISINKLSDGISTWNERKRLWAISVYEWWCWFDWKLVLKMQGKKQKKLVLRSLILLLRAIQVLTAISLRPRALLLRLFLNIRLYCVRWNYLRSHTAMPVIFF